MGLLDAAYLIGGIDILPAVAHGTRLWRPEVHAPRQCHGRVGVARRERVFR